LADWNLCWQLPPDRLYADRMRGEQQCLHDGRIGRLHAGRTIADEFDIDAQLITSPPRVLLGNRILDRFQNPLFQFSAVARSRPNACQLPSPPRGDRVDRDSPRTVPTVNVVFGCLGVCRSEILAIARPMAWIAEGWPNLRKLCPRGP